MFLQSLPNKTIFFLLPPPPLPFISIFINPLLLHVHPLSSSHCSKNQQYDSKWYIPLTELTFQGPEETEPLTIPQVPDEELDAIKVKISHLRCEIQREKVVWTNACFAQICSKTKKIVC